MKYIHLSIQFFLWTWVAVYFSQCSSVKSEKITIAAAANMQYAIDDIRNVFTQQTGIATEVVISSSGKLSAQIIEGAPFDVFISADTIYPSYIYSKGKLIDKPIIYAYGQLVVWSVKKDILWSEQLFDVDPKVKIALPNPAIAPYGRAAKDAMTNMGLYNQLSEQLVFGESVAPTNQYILSGAVDFGFTALSVVNSPKLRYKGHWDLVPPSYYSGIPQATLVVSQDAEKLKLSKQFVNFLLSNKSRQILEDFGYIVPDSY